MHVASGKFQLCWYHEICDFELRKLYCNTFITRFAPCVLFSFFLIACNSFTNAIMPDVAQQVGFNNSRDICTTKRWKPQCNKVPDKAKLVPYYYFMFQLYTFLDTLKTVSSLQIISYACITNFAEKLWKCVLIYSVDFCTFVGVFRFF